MNNTLDLSELTPQELGKMDNYEENEFEETKLLVEASADGTDETSETDDIFSRVNSFDSAGSLESEQSTFSDEDVEPVEKVNPIATVATEDDGEQDGADFQGDEVVSHLEGSGVTNETVDNVDPVRVPRQKSKWLANWFIESFEWEG